MLFILVIAFIACGESTSTDNTNSGSASSPASSTQTPQGQPTTTKNAYPHFGDGTFVVGKDIQPGTYRTRVASPSCYYARLKGFGGTVDDILANGNTDFPAIVTIAAT